MPINKAGRYTYQKQYSRWEIMQAQRSFHAQASQNYLANGQDALYGCRPLFPTRSPARATSPRRRR